MKIALLSDYCERKATEYRIRSEVALRGQNFGAHVEWHDKAAELERRAERARPQMVTLARVCPVPAFPRLIKSQTSFAVPEGVA